MNNHIPINLIMKCLLWWGRTGTLLNNTLPVKGTAIKNHALQRAHWCLSWDERTGEEENAVELHMKPSVMPELQTWKWPHAHNCGHCVWMQGSVKGLAASIVRTELWLQFWGFPLPRMQSGQEDVLAVKGCRDKKLYHEMRAGGPRACLIKIAHSHTHGCLCLLHAPLNP